MFPQTGDIWLKIHRYVPIWRHQSARIEPCGDYREISAEIGGFSTLARESSVHLPPICHPDFEIYL